jgi:large subunit ribosomal protein L31
VSRQEKRLEMAFFLQKKILSGIILSTMKADIHPKYFDKAKVTCACGNVFTTGSTKEEINVEICSTCHPFYTGLEKVLDTAGRVEKFKARKASASTKTKKTAEKK